MAVSVQLPGFQNHEAPINNIAGLAGAISDIATGFKKRANLDQDTQAKTLANQQAQTAQDIQKGQTAQMNNMDYDPKTGNSIVHTDENGNPADTQYTTGARKGSIGLLQSLKNAKAIKPDDRGHNPLDDIMGAVNNAKTGFQIDQIMNQQKPLLDLAKEQMAQTGQIGASIEKTKPQMIRNQTQANAQYNDQITPTDKIVLAANKIHGFIGEIQSGQLKATPALAHEIAKNMDIMFSQGGATTVSGSEGMNNALASLQGHAAENYGYVAGKSVNIISPDILSQVDKDILSAKDKTMESRSNIFNSFKLGLDPSLQGPLQKRFDNFGQNAGKSTTSVSITPEQAKAEIMRRQGLNK